MHRYRDRNSLIFLLVSCAFFHSFFANPAMAEDVFWSNPVDGVWSDGANWSTGNPPSGADNVFINLDGTYTVLINTPVSMQSLTLGSASGVQTLADTSFSVTVDGLADISGGGVLSLITTTVAGAGSISNTGVVFLRSASIAIPMSNAGTLDVRGASSCTALLSQQFGSHAQILGDATDPEARLTLSQGLTNNGTITLTSDGNNRFSTLELLAGTLTNAAGALIDISSARGSSRNILAEVENYGRIQVGKSSIIDAQDFNQTAPGSLIVASGTLTMNLDDGGSFQNGAGSFIHLSGGNLTLNYSGSSGTFVNAGHYLNTRNNRWLRINDNGAEVASSNSGLMELLLGGLRLILSSPGSNWTEAGEVFIDSAEEFWQIGGSYDMQTGNVHGPGKLRLETVEFDYTVSPSVRTLQLEEVFGTYVVPLQVDSLNTRDGTLHFQFPLDSISVNVRDSLTAPSIHIPPGYTFNFSEGIITSDVTIGGYAAMGGGTGNIHGTLSTLPGAVLEVINGTLRLDSDFVNQGELNIKTTSNVDQCRVIGIDDEPDSKYSKITNAETGTIRVFTTALANRHFITTELENLGTMIFGSNDIRFDAPSVDLLNHGAMYFESGIVTLEQELETPSFTNTDSIWMGPGAKLIVDGGRFDHLSGDIVGPGQIEFNSIVGQFVGDIREIYARFQTSTLELPSDYTLGGFDFDALQTLVLGPGKLIVAEDDTMTFNISRIEAPLEVRGLLQLRGKVDLVDSVTTRTGGTVNIANDVFLGRAMVTCGKGLVNEGTLILQGGVGNQLPALVSFDSGQLRNSASGVLWALGPANNGAIIEGEIRNEGLIAVLSKLVAKRDTAQHTNIGSLYVADSGQLVVNGGDLVNQSGGVISGSGVLDVTQANLSSFGSIAPGTSAGALTVLGGLTADPSSEMLFEIEGLGLGSEYDRLSVSGAITLAGSLHVLTGPGYSPVEGDEFHLIGFASRSGDISGYTGLDLAGGLTLVPSLTDTSLTLTIAQSMMARVIDENSLPGALEGHTANWDAGTSSMILFGGLGPDQPSNQVWVMRRDSDRPESIQWTRLQPSGTKPPPRHAHTAAYDPRSNSLIVFGGLGSSEGSPRVLGDLWILDNANALDPDPVAWRQVSLEPKPPGRWNHAAVFDPKQDRYIVSGGLASPTACGSALDDFWALSEPSFSSPRWELLDTRGGGPGPIQDHQLIFDESLERVLVLGGSDACGRYSQKIWHLTASTTENSLNWSDFNSRDLPEFTRISHGALHGGPAFGLLTSGGQSDRTTEAPWMRIPLDGLTPYPVNVELESDAKIELHGITNHSVVFDPDGNAFFVYGGRTHEGLSSKLWEITPAHTSEPIVPPGPEPTLVAADPYFVSPPRPNPTSSRFQFAVVIPRSGDTNISVYSVNGRKVLTIHDGPLAPGTHSFVVGESSSRALGSGVYYIRFRGLGRDLTESFVYVR